MPINRAFISACCRNTSRQKKKKKKKKAVKIRENTQWGLNIDINGNKNVIQISQLADDTTLFFESEEAIKQGLKIIEDFGKVSGLKLNKEKTEGLWRGRGTNRKDNFAGINWQKNTVKAFGVHFGYDKNKQNCSTGRKKSQR